MLSHRLSISITYDMLVDELLSLLKQNIVLVFVSSCLGIFGYPPKRVCIGWFSGLRVWYLGSGSSVSSVNLLETHIFESYLESLNF